MLSKAGVPSSLKMPSSSPVWKRQQHQQQRHSSSLLSPGGAASVPVPSPKSYAAARGGRAVRDLDSRMAISRGTFL